MITFLSRLLSIALFLCGCFPSKLAVIKEPASAALNESLQSERDEKLFDKMSNLPFDWWVIFDDEQLNTLIETALNQNPTLGEAYSKILLAASSAKRLRANLFPNVFLGADVSREKLTETGLIPFNDLNGGATPTNSATIAVLEAAGAGASSILPSGNKFPAQGGLAGIPVYFTQYETELALSYDFDFWQKNRNTYKAAIGEYYSKIADEAFIRLQLGISIALSYYKLQIDYKRAEIAKELIEIQSDYTRLIENRKTQNIENLGPVYNTLINLYSARQTLLEIEADIAVNEFQLKAYVAGEFDEIFSDVKISNVDLPKIPIPYDLPFHLIAYRPDIISELWLIESAGKQIEVAKAGFYPDFNLVALFGYQTLNLSELFRWKSSYYNVDPAISLPIFDAGRLAANLRLSEINYDLAIYRYNSLVINAVRDVLDGLTLLRNADLQFNEAKSKVDQQKHLLDLTILKKENNLSSELDVITSKQTVLIAKNVEIITLGKKIQAMLSLIKALGGGYENCYEIGSPCQHQ